MDLEVFAQHVKHIGATLPLDARFGRYKVFLYPIFDRLQEVYPELTTEVFVQRLLLAHRQAYLTLSRADLIPAMDPLMVQASEIHMMFDGKPMATFHFLSLPEKQ